MSAARLRDAVLGLGYVALVLALGVSDARMDQGSLRCDVNLSLRPSPEAPLGTRTETKTVNSFLTRYALPSGELLAAREQTVVRLQGRGIRRNGGSAAHPGGDTEVAADHGAPQPVGLRAFLPGVRLARKRLLEVSAVLEKPGDELALPRNVLRPAFASAHCILPPPNRDSRSAFISSSALPFCCCGICPAFGFTCPAGA